jgi:hypothetical protein
MTKAVTKQRLQKLESEIKKAAEEIQRNGIEIGKRLIEIRDDELWKADYDSFTAYLKEHSERLVGCTMSHSRGLIKAAEVAKKVPRNKVDLLTKPTHLQEIARLAPEKPREGSEGRGEKDFSKLRKGDVDRVLKDADKIAKEQGKESPSVRDVREAVDRDLGIDRKAEAKKKREQEERKQQIDLSDYLRERSGTIEGIHDNLSSVPAEMWDALQEQNPEVVERFTASLERLLDFMRG